MVTNTPDTDNSRRGDMVAEMGKWLRKELQQVDDFLPARVVSYDAQSKRAVVQPLVQIKTTGGQQVSRAAIEVPVYQSGGGGFVSHFPLKAGDFGHIKASDRDTSLVYQRKGGEDIPNTDRMKSFNDGIFYPDTVEAATIPAGYEDAAVMQSTDGNSFVALAEDKSVLVFGDSKIIAEAGAVKFEVGGMLLEFNGTQLLFNGIDIGPLHAHGGVTAGTSTTSVVST